MRTKILFAIVLLFCISGINSSLQATDINQTSGTISLRNDDYVNDLELDWNINTSTCKALRITYNVDTEENADLVYIYNVDSAGTLSLLADISGSQSGTIYTTSKSGKAKIIFMSDCSCCYAEGGYTGFDIEFSADERTEVSGLNVVGDAYISGNSYTEGKLGIGTINPQATLDTRGNAYISGLVGLGTVPSSAYKFYLYNRGSANTSLRTYTYQSSTSSVYGALSTVYNYSSGTTYGLCSSVCSGSGSAYGIYSDVSGSTPDKRWSGYFTGGKVEINSGKLHLTGSASTVNTTDAGRITFWDDARTTVTNSIIPNLGASSYSMPNYGMAAPLVTGGAELWLAGYSGLRMFTGGAAIPRLNISSEGNVGIGTTSPQYKLDVKGQIRATEVLIQSVDNFADYVFDKDYRLPELHEVKAYIDNNGHLPEIPSAKEAKENGVSLVDMQVKLLKKVEELTLYTIKQQEEIKSQHDEINSLKEKLEKLESGK